MWYIVNFDSENSSLMVTKESEGDWFTPTTKMYDVEEYDGVLKQTSLNLDIITPVNDFEDYAFVYSKVFLNEFGINSNNRLIGASYGECYKYLKDVLFPIFKEVYQTKQKKNLAYLPSGF